MFFQIIKRLLTIGLYALFMFYGPLVLGQVELAWQWRLFSLYGMLSLCFLVLWGKHLWVAFKALKQYWNRGFLLLEGLGWLLGTFILTNLILKLSLHSFIWEVTTSNNQNLLALQQALSPLLLGFLMIVLAPLVEELVFRESLIGWVPEKWRWLRLTCALVSVFLFDQLHVFESWEFYYYLGVSLALTAIYLRFKGNVAASLLLHLLINLFSYFFLLQGWL